MWKKIICTAAICGWAAIPAASTELYLKLGGGICLFSPQDVNRILTDWGEANRLEAEYRNNWSYLSRKSPGFDRGIEFAGELVFGLSSRIALSLGSGFLYGELQPEDTEVRILKPLGETVLAQPTTLSAVPLLAAAYYHIPLTGRFRIYFKAGTGLVWATYVQREGSRRVTAEKFGYTYEENATTRSPIYLGGLGFDFSLESHVRFYLEGTYRRLLLSGFTGGEADGLPGGTLYAYEEYSPDLDFWQAKFRLWNQTPTGDTIRAAREAEVDLSGFSLILGVTIRF
jgi:opacity protein-like surface antigen